MISQIVDTKEKLIVNMLFISIMNLEKLDNKRVCSKLQIRGVSNLLIPLDSIKCVESSEDKLIVRYDKGHVSDRSIQYLRNHSMFNILTNNPNKNKEILIRVLDKQRVDINKKTDNMY